MTLSEKVKEVANIDIGEFNLPKYKANSEELKTHCLICKKLVELSAVNNYPVSLLVYFAIGTNAHRSENFVAMYKKIDVEKAATIISWCKIFAEYHATESLKNNQVLSHVLTKFYDKVSHKTSDFKKYLSKTKVSKTISSGKDLMTELQIS